MIATKEQAAPEGGDHKTEPSLVRELEGKPVATASQEATSFLREYADVIDTSESPYQTDSLFDEAQAMKEKSTEASQAADEALNMFFEGMDIGALEDYSGLGHQETLKNTCYRSQVGRAQGQSL